MTNHIQFNKLLTYTDKSLIKVTPNETVVSVYAKAILSTYLEETRNYPRSEVTESPIVIEVTFPIPEFSETEEHILASAEALAQVAAISPDFFNIFGTKKGANITEILLVASQSFLVRFNEFQNDHRSSLCSQSLVMSSTYFYGAASRIVAENEDDWVKPLLSEKEKPFAVYQTSMKNTFDRLSLVNKHGKFLLTRVAIEDFIALPQRYIDPESVTRPFRAARSVLNQKFIDVIPGSPLAPKEEFNERGQLNKSFLVPNVFAVRLVLVEDNLFGEDVYVVTGMPPFLPKEVLSEHFKNGTDHITNSREVRNYIREKQNIASLGLFG
ncbi:hypothetical protein [Psychromonas sp. SP041]|uniref:hypothetical protein n=1 Tax=Psychromonas sp. SP041 TaxID=1365007 RepID=UPI0010C7C06C|nr:hypothetical protein [Psychromonas sp. SP041]